MVKGRGIVRPGNMSEGECPTLVRGVPVAILSLLCDVFFSSFLFFYQLYGE